MNPFIPYEGSVFPPEESARRSHTFYEDMSRRRTIRDFSDRAVDSTVIDQCILAAGTAPSGAHKQPWTFAVVTNAALKRQIREAAEHEEQINYGGRMSEEWIRDLAPLGTNDVKEFLEKAPVLIAVFKRAYELESGGHKHPNYYVSESVGIACGMLLAAIHQSGLVALTHTPSPMHFLEKILERPSNERAFLLIPVGYPSQNALVPDLKRKSLDEIRPLYA